MRIFTVIYGTVMNSLINFEFLHLYPKHLLHGTVLKYIAI